MNRSRHRSLCLAILVCVNVALLAGLALATSSAPRAFAQDAPPPANVAPGLATNYMFAAGEIQDQYDAVYMLDTRTHKLYVFAWDRGARELRLIDGRDLRRDFRNE